MAAFLDRQNIVNSPNKVRKRLQLGPLNENSPIPRVTSQAGHTKHHGDFKQGMVVFVPHDSEVWGRATVEQQEENTLVVCTETKQVLKLPRRDAVLCPKTLAVDNLTSLSPLSSPAVLECLEEHHRACQIYTNAGTTLVAVNPFQELPGYYGNHVMDTFRDYRAKAQTNTCPGPHIYRVAEDAYHQMSLGVGVTDQSIIVSGESGAGKTVSAKHLMKYLVSTGSSDKGKVDDVGVKIERRILDSNPILEAFGNAVTLRNHNSSRFGKYTQLHFDRSPGKLEVPLGTDVFLPHSTEVLRVIVVAPASRGSHLVGASIETYLLEKTRLVYQAPGEGNFHIFYQMLCGMEPSKQALLHLDNTFCWADPTARNQAADHKTWQATQEALDDVGLTSEQQLHILQVLSGLLHLGNFAFCPEEDDEDICVIDTKETGTSADICGELLGLNVFDLEVTFTHRRITATHRRRQSVFSKPCTLQETASRRDCLARLLYASLFEWLVDTINKCIVPQKTAKSIGLLDIYGFESFQDNSLEQLCINYANEKLQQHFVTHFLRDLQAEYEEEAISWQSTVFTDNRPCLELMEGNPGVFSLLNEECQLNRGCGDDELLDRLMTSLQSHTHLGATRGTAVPQFTVKHYASPVTYTMEALLEKNKDNVPCEVVEVLKKSTNPFIASLFQDIQLDQPGKKKKTVLAKFKSCLDSLMVALAQTQPHYVRCLKPNVSSKPGSFDRHFVWKQLEACGVLETVDIAKKGFPNRMLYEDFLQQYSLIFRLDDQEPAKPAEEEDKENQMFFDPLDVLYQKQLKLTPKRKSTPKKRLRRRAGLSSSDHSRKLVASIMRTAFGRQYSENPSSCMQFGRTKLFLKDGQLEQLESLRVKVLSQYAFCIQCAWRRYQNRRRRRAALTLQAAYRSWQALEKYQHKNSAVNTIQKAVRNWLLNRQPSNQEMTGVTSILSPLQACAVLAASPKVTGKDDEYIICKEQTPDGVTYHIMPSPRRDQQQPSPLCENKSYSSPLLKTPKRPVEDSYTSTPQSRKQTSPVVQVGSTFRTANAAFHTVGAAVSAAFLTRQRFQLAGAFRGIPYMEAKGGVLSRRRMPRVQIKFHTRPNPLLKYGHYISRQEFQCSLSDCLQEYD